MSKDEIIKPDIELPTSNGKHVLNLDLKKMGLASGVYLLTLKSENKIHTSKFVIIN